MVKLKKINYKYLFGFIIASHAAGILSILTGAGDDDDNDLFAIQPFYDDVGEYGLIGARSLQQ